MSAGFITQKEADLQRAKRQEEWDKVRTSSGNLINLLLQFVRRNYAFIVLGKDYFLNKKTRSA